MAVMHTTMIRASMTAYSTAVGPSSFVRKLFTRSMNLRIGRPFQKNRTSGETAGLRTHGGVQRHIVERLVGIAAQGGNRRDAHDDDQGEHHGILDCGGPILAGQKSGDA